MEKGYWKVSARQVWGIVKWVNVKNGCGFINRNHTKEDVSVHQASMKSNPRKPLAVQEMERLGFDVVEREKGGEAANYRPWWSPVHSNKYAANRNHYRATHATGLPRTYQRNYHQHSESGEE